MRLFLHRLLDERFIFYVDNDTVWGRDFRPELRALLAARPGRPIYMVRDCGIVRPKLQAFLERYLARSGHDARCFANSGVFIALNDPPDIERRLRAGVERFNRFGEMWPDQDVQNYMYSCDEKELIPPV
jgi:hypothetical protein